MSTLSYILIFSLAGSFLSMMGGLILLSRASLARKISKYLTALAAGTLLGTAFFDLMPEAEHLGTEPYLWVMAGILTFYVFERLIHGFHHHGSTDEHEPAQTTVPLIIFGDTLHNLIDGVVIAASFLVDIRLGIVTSLAVAAHEIPQEIGDFGVLLHKGLARGKVLLFNALSAVATMVGALAAYYSGSLLENHLPALLALTAGFFIYISLSDLVPSIHEDNRRGFAVWQSALLFGGIAATWYLVQLLHI